MSQKILVCLAVVSSLAALATPGDACGLTREEMQLMRANHDRAVAAGCEGSLVSPGQSIGAVYLGEPAADAAKSAAGSIAFAVRDDKVVRVEHDGPNACITGGWTAPLRVVGATSDVAPFADCRKTADGRAATCAKEGLALTRTSHGVTAIVVAAAP